MKKVPTLRIPPARRPVLAAWLAGLAAGILLAAAFFHATHPLPDFPSLPSAAGDGKLAAAIHLRAVLHYATTREVPQQTSEEIQVTLRVLARRQSPPKFLVFGLGRDSLMWAAFNPAGATLFLEEDPKWVQSVLSVAPELHASTIQYRTRLADADELLRTYRSEPACLPPAPALEGNRRCALALSEMPREVYEREWDLILIDGPRGFFAEAPGRMAAIYTAAVMARRRRGGGTTHVFLHDVDRRVERVFAEEFLCEKHKVEAVGRIWHFQIPPAIDWKEGDGFC